MALCTTLSSAEGKPNGRSLPERLGMYTRLTGVGWYVPVRSFSASCSIRSWSSSSPLLPSVPGVLNPLLARIASRARLSHSGWQINRYNLPKRLSGSFAASLARCICSCLTLFKGLVPSSFGTKILSTLPPFPMHAALPRSEYYGGSAPSVLFSLLTTYLFREQVTDGSPVAP